MKAGFAKNDITPRVGVELAGFGAFRCRHSIGVRDRLWARAMAIEKDGKKLILISCDLIGIVLSITKRVREIVSRSTGIPEDAIMLHSIHTHSGPNTGEYIGWGAPDEPYLETLPQRIAKACIAAAANMEDVTLAHAEVSCAGIGRNREYDKKIPLLEEALRDNWRPAMPERTDTTCHVITVSSGGRMTGFLSYFGCHPVVCCETTRYIHGDFCGVATNNLERENPGSVGLFLQGAQGDVNSCAAHQPEEESLRALDIIAERYAKAVRKGLGAAKPLIIDDIRYSRREVVFTRKKSWGLEKLRAMLAENEALVHAPDATDESWEIRIETVYLIALRRLAAAAEAGESLSPLTEIQGFRIGPLAMLGAPIETFQAIKNDILTKARSRIVLVMSLVNDTIGYAPDRATATSGGYAAEKVPIICGALPFENIHDELVQALLSLETDLYA